MAHTSGNRLSQYVGDYAVFDLETTGVSQEWDEIIEISAVRVRDHYVAEEFSTLVCPGKRIPAAATAINHITNEMVKGAPRIGEALERFLAFVGDDILVGHNIHSFDMRFLHAAAKRASMPEITNDYIDTLYMARKCLPELGHHKLVDLAEHFHISAQGAHRALNDCRMNQRCYEEMGKIMQKLGKANLQPEIGCPLCGAPMVRRKGRYGEFYGCSGFPGCRGTRKA